MEIVRFNNHCATYNFQVETIEDYDEYCHHVARIIGLGFLKLIRASGIEDFPPDKVFHSISVFAQLRNVPKSLQNLRMSWRLKIGENSIKAVNCLNEMIMNALIHTNDCLRYISTMQHPTIFQSCAMVQIIYYSELVIKVIDLLLPSFVQGLLRGPGNLRGQWLEQVITPSTLFQRCAGAINGVWPVEISAYRR
ncbi:squalene synthase-like [Olea europaea var. sylvestris]|uniref:squalene synthase-like n=1 Tax=Olea europaea var. sylvestris TaxID=158386 RepID=UPI000C1CD6B7|nr:squalene synthase-like [Olea europaea var. sylvestris]